MAKVKGESHRGGIEEEGSKSQGNGSSDGKYMQAFIKRIEAMEDIDICMSKDDGVQRTEVSDVESVLEESANDFHLWGLQSDKEKGTELTTPFFKVITVSLSNRTRQLIYVRCFKRGKIGQLYPMGGNWALSQRD